jgi:ubiquinone/menaquinone biosynthesis C-methylase UbiE
MEVDMSATRQPDTRRFLHGIWDAVAPGWDANGGFIARRGESVTARMLDLGAPTAGHRVLELGCGVGAGGPGFAAAARVAPGGEVVLSDVAPRMAEAAERRAAALGLEAAHTRVRDLESIDEPDGSFDVVFAREALMLVGDPALAASEIRRVLRPGGRAVVSVWGARGRNPWLGVVFDVVSEHVGVPMPPPGVPHPFSLDDPDRLAGVLRAGGLLDVDVAEHSTPYVAASPDEWWTRTTAIAGPLAQLVASLPADAARALRERAIEAISPYVTPDGLDIPGVSLIACGVSARR